MLWATLLTEPATNRQRIRFRGFGKLSFLLSVLTTIVSEILVIAMLQ